MRHKILPTLILALGALPLAVPAAAQRIETIEINVLSMPDRERIGTLRPGDTLELAVRQEVRLRMTAIPDHGGPRYPSTRFEVISGPARVKVVHSNEEVGNVTLRGLNVTNERNLRQPTEIRYEILDKLDIGPKLRTGIIRVEIVTPEEAVDATIQGMVLYEDPDFRGQRRQYEQAELASFRGTGLRATGIRSLRIEEGCEAVLYAQPAFQGAWMVVNQDIADLQRTRFGSTASSFRMDCSERDLARQGQHRRGVTLYEYPNFQGLQRTYSQDVRDLGRTQLGEDWASSARVDPGCEAVLYEHAEFAGEATVMRRDFRNLGNTRVGNETVSSLTVSCEE